MIYTMYWLLIPVRRRYNFEYIAINSCITYTEVVVVVGGWILYRQMSSYRSIPWKQLTSAPCGASVHYFQGMERYSDILLYVKVYRL